MKRIEITDKNNKEWFQGKAFTSRGFDPEFEVIVRNFLCGDILSHGELSDKQKSLLILTALTTSQTLKSLSQYTLGALKVGASAAEIKETLYQCAPYIGIEKVQDALDEVNRVFQTANITSPLPAQSTVTEGNRFEKGLTVQQAIFGVETINTMRAAAPNELKHIQDYLSAYCFGDFYTRDTLDLPMRELITFCAICTLGGCEAQAKAHAGANISVGNSREILIAAITQCLPFIGFPRALNAISCINQVTVDNN